MGHFGVEKTEDILATHFFWPKMRRDVERFVARCTTCQKAKSRLNPHGLLIEAGVSRSFDEMVTIDLVETTLTIRLQTCTSCALAIAKPTPRGY